jgi:hypothetical protein
MASLLRSAGERVVAFKGRRRLRCWAPTPSPTGGPGRRDARRHRQPPDGRGRHHLPPETCVIDAEVEVAPDTVIEPFVQLLGRRASAPIA